MTIDERNVVEALKASRKYGDLADAALVRFASWALARHANPKDAIKAAKRKLHQAHGAYFDGRRLPIVDRGLAAIEGAGPEAVRAICREVLAAHASTAERLPIVETFYARIFDITGVPRRLLDLGCGLNPFTLPWMGLAADSHYMAYELDTRLVERIRRFFDSVKQSHTTLAVDLLSEVPPCTADVALLLKTAPCLNQQEPEALQHIFGGIDATWIVVSFPVASLGGRNVGMRDHYADEVGRRLPRPLAAIEFESELVFVFRQ